MKNLVIMLLFCVLSDVAFAADSAPPSYAFLIGIWESTQPGNPSRGRYSWHEAAQEIRMHITVVGPKSRDVGFSTGEHAITISFNKMFQQPKVKAKFRTGVNGVTQKQEWWHGYLDTQRTTARQLVMVLRPPGGGAAIDDVRRKISP